MNNQHPWPAPFRARRGLSGPHVQTLGAQFLARRIVLPDPEERLFQVDEGVQVLCHCHWQPRRREALSLLIVHGLEGSSESHYVLGTAQKALAAGMNVVRMNVRNCGGTERLGPTLYHSGLSADVGAVARALISEESLTRLALAGFSMGGNIVLKLSGEWGRDAPDQLHAVAAVSPAIDLAASADALHLPQIVFTNNSFFGPCVVGSAASRVCFPADTISRDYAAPERCAVSMIRSPPIIAVLRALTTTTCGRLRHVSLRGLQSAPWYCTRRMIHSSTFFLKPATGCWPIPTSVTSKPSRADIVAS